MEVRDTDGLNRDLERWIVGLLRERIGHDSSDTLS